MRLEAWPQLLDEVLRQARSREFVYGAWDCALFAAECVQAMTGVDYAAELRGYDSKIAAYRIVASYGSLEQMITALLKREPIHPSAAHRGDVMLVEIASAGDERGECVGICTGTSVALPVEAAAGVGTLAVLPRASARMAWRIE